MSDMIIFAEGRFGHAVGERLQRQLGAGVHSLVGLAGEVDRLVAGATFVAVAQSRLFERECDEVDQACRRNGVSWSGVYAMQEMLYCGPLIRPDRGPCFSCFRKRYLTHHEAAEREVALLQAYGSDPHAGPPGFIPPMVSIAASALMSDAQAGSEVGGRLRRIDVCSGGLLETRILAVHGCPRCGRRSAGDSVARFTEYLVPAVEEILGPGGAR